MSRSGVVIFGLAVCSVFSFAGCRSRTTVDYLKQPREVDTGAVAAARLGTRSTWALAAVLGDKRRPVSLRVIAAEALAESRDERAAAVLMSALRDRTWNVRAAAAAALLSRGDRRGIPTLISLLRAENWRVRAVAVGGLGRTSDPRAIRALIAMLKDHHALVRTSAVAALTRTPGAQVDTALVSASNDPDASVRWQAAESLGQRRANLAVGALIRMLRDPDPRVRRAAAAALGRIGDLHALGPLAMSSIHDAHPEVRACAARAFLAVARLPVLLIVLGAGGLIVGRMALRRARLRG